MALATAGHVGLVKFRRENVDSKDVERTGEESVCATVLKLSGFRWLAGLFRCGFNGTLKSEQASGVSGDCSYKEKPWQGQSQLPLQGVWGGTSRREPSQVQILDLLPHFANVNMSLCRTSLRLAFWWLRKFGKLPSKCLMFNLFTRCDAIVLQKQTC